MWHRFSTGVFLDDAAGWGWPESELLEMAKQSLLKEFLLFIKHEKKWWLLPFVVVLLLIGAFLVFASTSPLAPFLYPLF